MYEFKVDPEQGLCIFEYDCSAGDAVLELSNQLQLLPRENVDIPQHLQEPYSHWYSRAKDIVLFRPPEGLQRDVMYIMTEEGTHEVAQKDKNRPLEDILQSTPDYPRLLLGETPLIRALGSANFEKNQFVLTFTDQYSTSIRYWLPRYGLSFVQNSDGAIRSKDHASFFVAKEQILRGTLPGFGCFVLMKSVDGKQRVLIPHLEVRRGAAMAVTEKWDDELHCHAYDIHRRFNYLIAADTLGRLHLASLYSSNSCLVPDRLMKRCGATVAVDLVRRCTQNEAFTGEEHAKLVEVSSHSSLSCCLRLITWWTWHCSASLVQPYQRSLERDPAVGFDALAADEYALDDSATGLTSVEEELLLGATKRRARYKTPSEKDLLLYTSRHVQEVTEMEELLSELAVRTPPQARVFPVDLRTADDGIVSRIVEDLQKSFETFSRLPVYSAGKVRLETISKKVSNKRQQLEDDLLNLLNEKSTSELVAYFLSGYSEEASSADLMRIAFDPVHAHSFQPAIERLARVQSDAIRWCLFCVLEDKLARVRKASTERKSDELIQDLRCVRNWEPSKHPRWVAFEVEQMIQIRPKQYTTVQQLLTNPGSVIQLNMGEGKTRVLVPMLIMELCKHQGKKARVNLLPEIFHEALNYYRRTIGSSVQDIKLFTLPFQRDFVLDKKSSNILSDEMRRCWSQNGCLMMTPQHQIPCS